MREASSSSSPSSSVEHKEQPRVSAGAANILKTLDSKSAQQIGECNICTPMVCFCPDDTWSNEAQESEKEKQPQQV